MLSFSFIYNGRKKGRKYSTKSEYNVYSDPYSWIFSDSIFGLLNLNNTALRISFVQNL